MRHAEAVSALQPIPHKSEEKSCEFSVFAIEPARQGRATVSGKGRWNLSTVFSKLCIPGVGALDIYGTLGCYHSSAIWSGSWVSCIIAVR